MGFFACTSMQCQHHKEWEEVIRQVQKWSNWHDDELYKQMSGYGDPHDIEARHLEAKALYVFTMARRWVRAVYQLARSTRDWVKSRGNVLADGEEWKLVFVETTSLLFPMIELVAHARLDDREATTAYKRNEVPVVANLWAGLHWLRDPKWLPRVKTTI
jgi:hypothetical protein